MSPAHTLALKERIDVPASFSFQAIEDQTFDHLPHESGEGIFMEHSLGNRSRTFRGDPRVNIAERKQRNQDWLAKQAARLSEKQVAERTGLSPRAVGNLRQRRNKISFDNFVDWCLNDPEFASAFAEYVGLIHPGEAEFAGALTQAFNAYNRRMQP